MEQMTVILGEPGNVLPVVEQIVMRMYVEHLLSQGWKLLELDDGGDDTIDIDNVDELLNELAATYEIQRIYLCRVDENKKYAQASLVFVPGNGEDCLSDYSVILDQYGMEHVTDKLQELIL